MSTVTISRKPKWQPSPPPPPSPKVLHFPRTRRNQRRKPLKSRHSHCRNTNTNTNTLLLMHHHHYLLSNKGKLENLFHQENDDIIVPERRERVEDDQREEQEEFGESRQEDGFEEEKWKFQAEILRAECNFLRMERELALKKLERNRVKMERTLRSAVQTLVAGREKIFEGKNANAVLEEEIEDLEEKLEELQRSFKVKDVEVRKCSNFDEKACVLQRRLEKLGGLADGQCVKELPDCNKSDMSLEIDQGSSCVSNCISRNKSTDVDEVKRRMEGLSKGILERVGEDCGSILCRTANSSVASSASTSNRIDQFPDLSAVSSSTRQLYQEPALSEVNKCSGRCKSIIRRIVEQVRAETEQWSQMQEMLKQVRGEMEELQASRDFWENRAHSSEIEIQSLRLTVDKWKEKALGHETKANELQLELSQLQEELQKTKADTNFDQDLRRAPLRKQLEKEKHALSCRTKEYLHSDERRGKVKTYMDEELNMDEIKARSPAKDFPPISLGKQLAKEKRMHLHRLKENRRSAQKGSMEEFYAESRRKPRSENVGPKRSPLKDIGNASPLSRLNGRADYPFHSPEKSRTRESFRK